MISQYLGIDSDYIIIGLAAILLIGACIFSFRIDNSGKEDAITDNPKTK